MNSPITRAARRLVTGRFFWLSAALFLLISTAIVLSREKVSLLVARIGERRTAEGVTVIARADGSFDIKEFPRQNQWFAPEVVGDGLRVTATARFGARVKPASVLVLVRADAGAHDEAVRTALYSARAKGFVRFGFVDPRLGRAMKQATQ